MVGQNIGKYRVLDRIGRGGMGTVYRAVDETLHREVAIKVLNTELNDPAVARRFRAEAVTVARLNHPGIATVYELFQHEGEWLMVMEFVRGETLEALVTRKGPLPVEQAADLCMQALAGLAHAHSLGVVHRDLKPANLMITESGVVKVMDFGIARVTGAEHLTSAGFMLGTPAYMAPEQVLAQDIDARADLYSMGVVFFHLLTAKLPFKGETPFEMAQSRIRDEPTSVLAAREGMPGWLAKVMDLALARTPDHRFQTAPLFREALRRGLANLPLETAAPQSIPPELIATAAPRSLPVLTHTPMALPSPTSPPASAMPTMVSAAPTPPSPSARPAVSASRNRMVVPIAAGAVVILMAGGWMLTRSRRGGTASVTATTTAPHEPSPSPAPPPNSASDPAPPAAAASALAPVEAPKPPPKLPTAPSGAASVPAAGPAPSASPTGAATRGAATPTGPAAAAASAPGRGRAAVSDPHVAFENVRGLVVTGRKAEEQDATLNFVAGRMSVVLKRTSATVGVMPYREMVRATYVHTGTPKWDPTLAAPPTDVDLPGGVLGIRSAKHWLSVQSRTTYLIVRLNDSDFRKILDTFALRTTLKVEPPGSGQ